MPQVAKVKKLVANGDYGSLALAIGLLSTLEPDENVWLSLFTKNILNNQLKSRRRETLELFEQAASSRLNQGFPLEKMITNITTH